MIDTGVEDTNVVNARRASSLYYATPGAFNNFWSGAGASAMLGYTGAAGALADVGSVIPQAYDALGNKFTGGHDTSWADAYRAAVEPVLKDANDYWRPTAEASGWAAQAIGGLIPVVNQFAINWTLPAVPVADTEMRKLVDEGVPMPQVQEAGIWNAAMMLAGAKIPMAGKGLLQKTAIAAPLMAAQGMITTGVERKILEGTGVENQYDPFDRQAIMTNALMGIMFGGVAHLHDVQQAKIKAIRDSMKPSDVDALLTLNNNTAMVDAAPGVPKDATAANDHYTAINTAIADILSGRVTNASVDPSNYHASAPDNTIAEAAVKDSGPRLTEISDGDFRQAVEQELIGIAGNRAEPRVIPAIKQELSGLRYGLSNLDDPALFSSLAKEAQGEGLSRKQAEAKARKTIADRRSEIEGKIAGLEAQVDANAKASQAEQDLALLKEGGLSDGEKQSILDRWGLKAPTRVIASALDMPGQQFNLFTHMRDQLMSAGYAPENADMHALAKFPFYVDLARKLGTTPDQAYLRYGSNIEGEVRLPDANTTAEITNRYLAENPDAAKMAANADANLARAQDNARLFQNLANCLIGAV